MEKFFSISVRTALSHAGRSRYGHGLTNPPKTAQRN
jgi:hypothetical protein